MRKRTGGGGMRNRVQIFCSGIRGNENGKNISRVQDKRNEPRGPRSGLEGMAPADRRKGFTEFQPGANLALHIHNCEEQVTILEGEATAIIDGVSYKLTAPDTTFISQGLPHRFINTSNRTMKILWVYTTTQVTRTFVENGKTDDYLKK
jgi:mannose-6-phosphate isomerase-like protein (cupin superfamily)